MSASGLRFKPIALVPVRPRQAPDTSSIVAASLSLGLYESVHGAGASIHEGRVPPLTYFCIKALVGYPDQVHTLGSHRIKSQPEVLRILSPSTFGDGNQAARCLCKLDPRLWSVIVQVCSGLPKGLRNYYIPLGDRHLPLLQAIPSTPSFALVTVLDLAGCVSDETSHALKSLHGLCALDVSETSISHLGIRHFAPTVTDKSSEQPYGTRGLRILRLNKCHNITDQVIAAISNFPLLTILGSCHLRPRCRITHTKIDLRGTSCTRDLDPGLFRRCRKSQRDLFQCSLQDALQRLRDSGSSDMLFSHPDPFVIHINTESHPPWPQRPDRPKPAPPLSIERRFYRYEKPWFMEAERNLREWIRPMLGSAANEHRISEIANFVVRRWEYDLEWYDGYEPHPGFHSDDDNGIDSWDEESSTKSVLEFCGYKVNEDLVESVRELVDKALKEHESANRFYGLDSRAPKAAFCHCRQLRGFATPLSETKPTHRHHMLVRDPPPWDSVYEPDALPRRKIMLGRKPSISGSSHLTPDRSSERVRKSMQEMSDMIASRSLPTTATPHLSSIPTVTKNPFRKDPTRGLTRGGFKDLHQQHSGSARGGNSSCVSNDPAPKRMRSISQIPVPPRPTPLAMPRSTRAKNLNEGASGRRSKKSGHLKQTTLLGVFGKQT